MSSPFSNDAAAGSPGWTAVTNPSGTFTPLSRTGQIQITGGFGLGAFGAGGFGEGETTTLVINTVTITPWTVYTTK